MELPFPLEMGKNEMDGSDDDGMSYQTSRGWLIFVTFFDFVTICYIFFDLVTICYVFFNFVTFCYAARMKPIKIVVISVSAGGYLRV